VALLMAAALLVGCGGGEDAWKEFRSEAGGFSILMPGTPTEETQTQATELGDIDIHMFSYEAKYVAYMVGYNLLPQAIVALSAPDALLDGACEGQSSSVGGVELSRKEIALDGYPGREMEIQAEDEGQVRTLHTRIYLVKDKLYQILVVGDEDQRGAEDTLKFLDSFKLLEQ